MVDLVGEVANAAGNALPPTPPAVKKPKMSDDELQQATQGIVEKAKALWQKRHGLDPANPEHQKQISEIDAQLLQNRKALTDLYHPIKNPGALERVGKFFKSNNFWGGLGQAASVMSTDPEAGDKFQKKFQERIANTPEARAKAELAGAQGTPAQPNPYVLKAKQLQEAGFTPEQIKKIQEIDTGLSAKPVAEKGTPTKYQPQLTTTTDAAGKMHYWRVPLEEGGKPEEVDFQGQKIQPKTTGQPKVAWKKLPNGRYVSMQLDENNHFKPGTENYDQIPPASIVGRISTGNFHFVDEKGQVHQVQETRTSMPAGQGGAGAAAPSPMKGTKTPGQMKKELQDKVIGFKGSKDYNDTKTAYEAAVDRTDTMDKNLQNAMQGDQQAMLSLVANHIGMTLGAQRGARITRAVWDEAISSTPWLAKVAAKWSNDGYLSGVTLAPEQMKQMVRLAHEKTQTLKEHIDRLDKERGGGRSAGQQEDMISVQIPGHPPGKIHVSQKAAFMKKYPNAKVQ